MRPQIDPVGLKPEREPNAASQLVPSHRSCGLGSALAKEDQEREKQQVYNKCER